MKSDEKLLIWYDPLWSHRRSCPSLLHWIEAWIAPPRGAVVLSIVVGMQAILTLVTRGRSLAISLLSPPIGVFVWILISYFLRLIPRGIRLDSERVCLIGMGRQVFSLRELRVAWIEEVNNRTQRQLVLEFNSGTVYLGLPRNLDDGALAGLLRDKLQPRPGTNKRDKQTGYL